MLRFRQFVSSGTCLKCDGCCRFAQQDTAWSPVLLDKEIDELTGKGIIPQDSRFTKKILLKPQGNTESFICTFFNPRENKCLVFPYRPFDCRLYPFLLARRAKRIFLAVDLHCPFIKKNIKAKEFKNYITYLIKLFNGRNFSALIKNNPHIAQEYPEITILKELNI